MKIDWVLMAVGIGIFVASCFLPIVWLNKSNPRLIRAYAVYLDAVMTAVSFILCVMAFSNRWWGFFICLVVTIVASSAFHKVIGPIDDLLKEDASST